MLDLGNPSCRFISATFTHKQLPDLEPLFLEILRAVTRELMPRCRLRCSLEQAEAEAEAGGAKHDNICAANSSTTSLYLRAGAMETSGAGHPSHTV